MTITDLWQSSLQSLRRTKARTALTMLGIIIGVTSVILVLSIGEAAQRFILAQISSFGSDLLFISNGPQSQEGQPSLFVKESLTQKDADKFRLAPWIVHVAGKLIQEDSLTANGFDTNVQLVGTTPDEPIFTDAKTSQGAFFSQPDVEGHARVAVLGWEVAKNSFGAEDPIGKTVKIGTVGFRVVGVMEQSGTKAFQNIDKQVYVPVTSALDLYNKKYLTYIQVKVGVPIREAKDRITIALRERHNIDNPNNDLTKDDFHVQSQEDVIKSTETITNILQILLISIAAISLIVGGIGIMNIMYVSVTERIKEIGLRKSIGARESDILRQFLVEAVIQTVAGGIVGIVIGTAFSWLGILIIQKFQDGWTFAVSTNGVVLGLVVSAIIGVTFGYFPARKAARLHPIEALRAE